MPRPISCQRRIETWRGVARVIPTAVAPTSVLQTRAEAADALAQARQLRLPLHHDRVKNWDALGALGAVLALAGRDGSLPERVMDAGSARYSPILPWLRLYGLGGVAVGRGDEADVGAVTCMSVIEHGVPLVPFLAESARILRPGGVLVVSTDYDQSPPDTTGRTAYGVPVHIFGPEQIRAFVADAATLGLDLVGDLSDEALAHPERPCHWSRVGLDYTFILLTFRRR